MMIRKEFTGMLPAAIEIFNQLIEKANGLNPHVLRGYDCQAGKESFFYWGAAAQITCENMKKLRSAAEKLGVVWLDDDGSMACAGGLTIEDFKTYRVNGALQLMPEKEEV